MVSRRTQHLSLLYPVKPISPPYYKAYKVFHTWNFFAHLPLFVNFAQKFRRSKDLLRFLRSLGFLLFTTFVNFAQKSLRSKALYPIFNRHRACCLSCLEFFRSFTPFCKLRSKIPLNWWRRRVLPPGPIYLFHSAFRVKVGYPTISIISLKQKKASFLLKNYSFVCFNSSF